MGTAVSVVSATCKIWLESYGLNVQNPGDTCCAMGWKMNVCEECVQKQKLSGGSEMVYSL